MEKLYNVWYIDIEFDLLMFAKDPDDAKQKAVDYCLSLGRASFQTQPSEWNTDEIIFTEDRPVYRVN